MLRLEKTATLGMTPRSGLRAAFGGRMRPPLHESFRLGKFEGDEFGWLRAEVGDGVRVVAGEPFGVAGFEVAGHGALALDVAADV